MKALTRSAFAKQFTDSIRQAAARGLSFGREVGDECGALPYGKGWSDSIP